MHSNPELETLITEATVFSIAMAVVMLLLVFSIPLKPALQLLWSIIKLINAKLGNRGLGHCTYYQTKKMPRQQPYAEKLAACQSTYPTKSYHPVDELDDAFNELEQKLSTGKPEALHSTATQSTGNTTSNARNRKALHGIADWQRSIISTGLRILKDTEYPLSRTKEPPIMPLRWTQDLTNEVTANFLSLPTDRQHAIDMKVMQLFCNMGIIGLLTPALPATLTKLNPHQIAQFRQLVLILESTFAHIDFTLTGPPSRTDMPGDAVSIQQRPTHKASDTGSQSTSTPTQVHIILNGRLHVVTNPIIYERIADLCGMTNKSPSITYSVSNTEHLPSRGYIISGENLTIDKDQLDGKNCIINCTCTTAGHH